MLYDGYGFNYTLKVWLSGTVAAIQFAVFDIPLTNFK